MAIGKKDKAFNLERELSDHEAEAQAAKRMSGDSEHKRIRRINPLGMRVVVRIIKETSQTESGLYLPEGSKQGMAESLVAEVVEVASAIDDHTDEETNVSGVPLGASVLIQKDAGVRVPWDDALRIVETKDILAMVHEVSIS
jgi:co-chaperonin GroES (HSP10)